MISLNMGEVVVSIDGACSGKRCACAAVLVRDGRVIAQRSRRLPEIDGYALAAEIAAVAVAAELVKGDGQIVTAVIETDNPDVPRVIEQGYRPKQAGRIPAGLLAAAVEFARARQVRFEWLARNSTVGLRHAHRLASRRLWSRRAHVAKV
jgi:ribonuclease HI